MEYSFWGGLMLMVLMADPLGNIPITISCMKGVPNNRRVRVLFRECMIAMGMLLLAMFFGRPFLAAVGLSDAALSIGGSVIVMLMAIRMVFPTKEGVFGETPGGEPYIVPIAIPAIAGPSTIATIMMLAASQPDRSAFSQAGFAAAWTECDDYAEQVRAYVKENLAFAHDFFEKRIPSIRSYMPEASYLMWLDCSALGFNTQADLTRFFLEEAKVAMNPGESFGPGGKNHMRLNTACPRSILEEALSRIEAAADKRMAELAAK